MSGVFSYRYRVTWRTPSSISTRTRISPWSSTWRWAPSWPPRPRRATPCRIRTPPARRWPPCQSWGTDTCPPSVTAATPTAPSPCLRWPVTTARWVGLRKESESWLYGTESQRAHNVKLKHKLWTTDWVTDGWTVVHEFCALHNTLMRFFFQHGKSFSSVLIFHNHL